MQSHHQFKYVYQTFNITYLTPFFCNCMCCAQSLIYSKREKKRKKDRKIGNEKNKTQQKWIQKIILISYWHILEMFKNKIKNY